MAENTNLYATQLMTGREFLRIFWLLEQEPVTAVEMCLYLEVSICSGLVYKSRELMY